MAEQKLNAPARAQYEIRRSPAGVRKVTEYQDPGYTIVGNHLTQHRSLSGLAIGLAAHIQSLPEGAPVDIRTLARRFPEGRVRIAAALRELEAYGYLERVRRRTDDGRVVTVTISYNNPEATRARRARDAAEQAKRHAAVEPPPPAPDPVPVRQSPQPDSTPKPAPTPKPSSAPTPSPAPQPPEPATDEHHTPAAALLANLRRDDPRLLLSVRDIHRLTPPVAAWLERGASPEAVRSALTAGLPPTLRHPAALLAHRLTELLPPPLPAAPTPPCAAPPPAPPPFQTCDGCERAFRAPAPGLCRNCRHSEPQSKEPPSMKLRTPVGTPAEMPTEMPTEMRSERHDDGPR
ncbi:helix-turn-helix domain-containing protein [Streptomyces lydicus]|uniref:helix-turn-helix domain-containing protein n=1 Tax=Streptomyces lydicus TaxID=47763 RepID=UPI001F506D1F|nr:helix-turn-helix domain-containing protein [Streptomyces lydicus]